MKIELQEERNAFFLHLQHGRRAYHVQAIEEEPPLQRSTVWAAEQKGIFMRMRQ